MPSHEPFESIREQLICRGLPLDYVEHSVAELIDHHSDITQELCCKGLTLEEAKGRATERLGDSRTLATRIVRDYQRRTWCGRWPLVSFALAPLPLVILGQALVAFAIYACLFVLASCGLEEPSRAVADAIIKASLFLMLTIAPAIVAFWWSRMALKKTRSRVYAAATCIIIATYASGFISSVEGECISLGYSLDPVSAISQIEVSQVVRSFPTSSQLCRLSQLMGPLTMGAITILFDTRLRRRALLA